MDLRERKRKKTSAEQQIRLEGFPRAVPYTAARESHQGTDELGGEQRLLLRALRRPFASVARP
jgi:hypothetical protein